MRHTITYIVALMALALGLYGCKKDAASSVDAQEAHRVSFAIETALRAVGDESTTRPTPALEREKKITDLYAVIYRTSSGIHYKTVKCDDKGEGKYEFDNGKSGDFYFFLIANPDQDLLAKLQAGPTTPDDLGMLVAKQTPGEGSSADHFLMTSDRVNVKVLSKQETAAGVIPMTRVAARFDIYNAIEGLTITKVTFGARRVESHLFAQVGKMEGLKITTDKTYEGTLFQDNVLKATIYSYETDIRSEAFFTIEATYKGKELKPETVRLENFAIKRNHLYNIILHDVGGAFEPGDEDKKFGNFAFSLRIADWNEDETLAYDEDNILKPLHVDYQASISNAPYMTPYLSNSPTEIYTTTKGESEVTLTVGGYMRPAILSLKEGFSKEGVTLTEVENSVKKDPNTGKITRQYKLTIPASSDFIPLIKEGKIATPVFEEIPLVAKNFSEATVKEFTIKHGRIKMPLEYVAEHSLAPKADDETVYKFAQDDSKWKEVGYFYVPEAVKELESVTIDKKNYHIPIDIFELASIFPWLNNKESGFTPFSVGETAGSVDNVYDWVTMPCWVFSQDKDIYLYVQSDYRTNKEKHVSYALRLKNCTKGFDNMLVTAYRYEWVGDFGHVNGDVISSYYKVTSRYLGPNWNGGVKGVSDEKFWNQNNENDATRLFYALGNIDMYYSEDSEQRTGDIGTEYRFITSAFADKGHVYSAALYEKGCYANSSAILRPDSKASAVWYPVRLFSNK